jgi:DNA-binding MarR family transcriptional regulator
MADNRSITGCPIYLITRASLATVSMLKDQLAAAGAETIRPAYLGVLMCLWRQDGQRVVDLGRCAGLEPSTMTGLLDRMVRDGLVSRAPDPDDRRAQRIQLTARGRKAEKAVSRVVDQALSRLFEGVPERDLDRLKETLRRVLGNANRLEQ